MNINEEETRSSATPIFDSVNRDELFGPVAERILMSRQVAVGSALGLLVAILVAGGVYYLFINNREIQQQASTLPSPTKHPIATSLPTVTITSIPIPTLAPPLAQLEFPTQEVSYPQEWPPDLRYPDEFSLVEASSGTLPDGESQGWAAKLRYRGAPKRAADHLSSFLTAKGWQVKLRDLGSGGILITVEKNNKESTGAIIFDLDTTDSSYTRILSTIRL